MISFRPTREKTRAALYAFFVLAGVAVFCCALLNLGAVISTLARIFSVFSPIAGGFVIAYLLNPLYNLFSRRVFAFTEKKRPHPRLHRALSIVCVYVVVLGAFALLLRLFIPQLIDSWSRLSESITAYAENAEKYVVDFVNSLPFVSERFENISDFVDVNKLSSEIGKFITGGYDLFETIVEYAGSYASAIASGFGNTIMALILSVYLLLGRDKLLAQAKKLRAALLPESACAALSRLAATADRTFGGYVRGALLDAIIVGAVLFVACSLVGIPYAPLVAVICGATNIIPYFGPFIGAIPSAFLIFIDKPGKVLPFVIVVLVVQQIDGNLVCPRIMRGTTGLSQLWVVTALTVCGGLMGFAGLIIGIPVFAMAYEFIKRSSEKRLAARGLPVDTADYYPPGDGPDEDKPSAVSRAMSWFGAKLGRFFRWLAAKTKKLFGKFTGSVRTAASRVSAAIRRRRGK